jgi:hypothetical protein
VSTRLRAKLVAAAIALWAFAACSAVFAYTSHATQAAPEIAAPATWPADAALARATDRATLVVLVHPMCPCSRATLRELARLLARTRDRLATRVVFMRSIGTGADPRASSLWSEATQIPGVVASVDERGTVAHAFGAVTSGQTLLYGAGGELLFAGGITRAGGHEGDSAGRDAIEELVMGTGHAKAKSSVFGCPLFF